MAVSTSFDMRCRSRNVDSHFDFELSGRRKLNMGRTETLLLCLEEDGTVVDVDALFSNYLTSGYTTFMLLRENETWMPRAWITYGSRSMPDAYGTPLGKLSLRCKYRMYSLCK